MLVVGCTRPNETFGLDNAMHLGGQSPCIDAGVMAEASDHDIDGEQRPQGGGVDIGADEAN